MIPLQHDSDFTFRFAEDRIIPRIHLNGVERGKSVAIYSINTTSGERQQPLASAVVGDEGWVVLPVPIIVRAGEGFVAIVEDRRTPIASE